MYLFTTLTPPTAKKTDVIKYSISFMAVVCVLAAISYLYIDQNLTMLFKDDDWKWVLAREITHIGLFTNYFIPAFIIWMGAQILLKWKKPTNRDRVKRIATLATWLMYCLLFSGLWTHIIKALVGRQRPKISIDFDPSAFQPLITHWDYHSMPSGHTQVVFTVATFIAYLFPKYKYGFYILAFAMAFTRVMTRDHFYSDILIGMAVGHIATVLLLQWLSQRNYGRPT